MKRTRSATSQAAAEDEQQHRQAVVLQASVLPVPLPLGALGLEAAQAAALLHHLREQEVKTVLVENRHAPIERSPVVLRNVFSAAEIAMCHDVAASSGSRCEPATAWRTPPDVCAALADKWYDTIYSPFHVSLFLHRPHLFRSCCPDILDAMVRAMDSARLAHGVDPTCSLQVRCIELHSYSVGGALQAPSHRDSGSTLTMSLLLSDAASFDGGNFVTWHEGTPVQHVLGQGDVVVINSESLHNVSMVTRGVRQSLVCELWAGAATTRDRFE